LTTDLSVEHEMRVPRLIRTQLQVVQLAFLFSAAPHKFHRTTVVEDQRRRRMPVRNGEHFLAQMLAP